MQNIRRVLYEVARIPRTISNSQVSKHPDYTNFGNPFQTGLYKSANANPQYRYITLTQK